MTIEYITLEEAKALGALEATSKLVRVLYDMTDEYLAVFERNEEDMFKRIGFSMCMAKLTKDIVALREEYRQVLLEGK